MDAIETTSIATSETDTRTVVDASLLLSHPSLFRLAYPDALVCGVCQVHCESVEKLEEHREVAGCGYNY